LSGFTANQAFLGRLKVLEISITELLQKTRWGVYTIFLGRVSFQEIARATKSRRAGKVTFDVGKNG
jgi:hypothetical protein